MPNSFKSLVNIYVNPQKFLPKGINFLTLAYWDFTRLNSGSQIAICRNLENTCCNVPPTNDFAPCNEH